MNIYFDSASSSEHRRSSLYEGDAFVYRPFKASLDFVHFTRKMVAEAFQDLDPRTAQHHMKVRRYVKILTDLKPRFIHNPQSSRHLRDMMLALGCDPDLTYFDVPRLRTSTSHGYLTSGISYTYHAHRDTWYSAPMCQQNWWLPVYEIEAGNCMAFHPSYFNKAIANGSGHYAYQDWVKYSRPEASKHITTDTRKQPHPEEPISHECEQRLITDPGGAILFSAAQLHSSVPNFTGKTRFSIDFRTVNLEDLENESGAPNLDCFCSGTNLVDYRRVSDLAPLPDAIIKRYSVINQELHRAKFSN